MKRMLRLLILWVVLALGHVHPLIAQWVQTSGAGNNNVTNFAVSGSNLFAGFNARYDSGGVILASGVYFYRLQAEGFVKTRKFLLLK
jgi:hypothetical protein